MGQHNRMARCVIAAVVVVCAAVVLPGRAPLAAQAQQQTKPPAQPPPVATPPAQGQAQKPGTAKQTPPGAPPEGQEKKAAPTPGQEKKAAPVTAQSSGRLSAIVFVTDPSGKALPDINVTAIGANTREVTTDRDGVARLTALRAGTYRLRFEAPEIITFERELVMKAGPAPELEVTLNRAPAPPPQPAAPAETPAAAAKNAKPEMFYAPTAASLPNWIERNYIGRTDPSVEGLVGQTIAAGAWVLQIRDPLKDRARADADQLFYVIAGDGTARVGDRQDNITAGWFIVVPRGTSCSFERRGRNPLILLAVVAPPAR